MGVMQMGSKLNHIAFVVLACCSCSVMATSFEEEYGDPLFAKAKDGDAEAQYALGVKWRNGDLRDLDVGHSEEHALYWISQAALQGHVEALKEFPALVDGYGSYKPWLRDKYASVVKSVNDARKTYWQSESESVPDSEQIRRDSVTKQKVNMGAAEEHTVSFEGMFGVMFGQVMPDEKVCNTNDSYSLVYEYEPAKKFNAFESYLIFASPNTRQVYHVRAVYTAKNDFYAERKIDEVSYILEMKYGKTFSKLGKDRVLWFPNGDQIWITYNTNIFVTKVRVEAMSAKYTKKFISESNAMKMKSLAKEIESMDIIPSVKMGEKVVLINGIFGREFGTVLSKDGTCERSINSDSVFNSFYPSKRFYKYTNYTVYATPESRKIHTVRAGCRSDDSEVFDKTVELLEMMIGKSFEGEGDSVKHATCAGANGIVVISIAKKLGWIYFEVTDLKLYELARDEYRQRVRNSSDFDAL